MESPVLSVLSRRYINRRNQIERNIVSLSFGKVANGNGSNQGEKKLMLMGVQWLVKVRESMVGRLMLLTFASLCMMRIVHMIQTSPSDTSRSHYHYLPGSTTAGASPPLVNLTTNSNSPSPITANYIASNKKASSSGVAAQGSEHDPHDNHNSIIISKKEYAGSSVMTLSVEHDVVQTSKPEVNRISVS